MTLSYKAPLRQAVKRACSPRKASVWPQLPRSTYCVVNPVMGTGTLPWQRARSVIKRRRSPWSSRTAVWGVRRWFWDRDGSVRWEQCLGGPGSPPTDGLMSRKFPECWDSGDGELQRGPLSVTQGPWLFQVTRSQEGFQAGCLPPAQVHSEFPRMPLN